MVRGQAARDVLAVLLRDRLAFGKDVFALSAPGAFERLVDRAGQASSPRRGTVELAVGDETVTLTVTDTPDTTLPPLPERGNPMLPRLGHHVSDNYYDDPAGGILLDRLAGCRIEYSCADSGDHLLILDADASVPHVQTAD